MPTNTEPAFAIRQPGPADLDLMEALLNVFGRVFEEESVYCQRQPTREYMERLLEGKVFIALTAVVGGQVVGGVAGYELPKFEQERSEIYIYDLAVLAEYRRMGIATALINGVRKIASSRGAHVIFVQADHGDDPAISLYAKLGTREDVLHFDIKP